MLDDKLRRRIAYALGGIATRKAMTKISIITVSLNSEKTIAATLRSVASQSGVDREHIVVDGGSTDGTMEIVRQNGSHLARAVSEPDRGTYDAMNKGLAMSSGDLVGFLNSDDRYVDHTVLSTVAAAYEASAADFVYGDLEMVNQDGRVVRYWQTGDIPTGGLTRSQIPHPVLFICRRLLNRITPAFDPSYRISADLKQQLILINKMRAKGVYVRRPLTRMSLGGASTAAFSGYLSGWKETARAYNELFGRGGWWYTAKKVSSKIPSLRWSRAASVRATTL
jgi:glycosyltransferase